MIAIDSMVKVSTIYHTRGHSTYESFQGTLQIKFEFFTQHAKTAVLFWHKIGHIWYYVTKKKQGKTERWYQI